MHTIEDIRLIPVWVNPEHLVSTARHIMSGHKVSLLAVLEGPRIVGTVTRESLICAPEGDRIDGYVMPLEHTATASMTVREAAELFVDKGLEAVPVLKQDRFVGILTSQHLLNELKHSWDPLTGLPWSDRLRDWGVENLKIGREITLLFLDIDEFGFYNKRFGHIVGDRVLKKVAQALSDAVDPSKDVLVRYGGDEFAIGTIRERDQADALGANIRLRVDSIFLEDSDERITFSLGIQGGKRTHERENTHYAATLDNLINLASKEALSKKKSGQQALPLEKEATTDDETAEAVTVEEQAVPEEKPKVEPKVVGVYTDENAPNSLTIVILNVAGTVVSGVHQRSGKTVLQSIATATGKALQRLNRDTQYIIDDILMVDDSAGDKFLTITGRVVRADGEKAVSGILKLGDDLYRSAVDATLHTFADEITQD
jgi:IMP dehydrogenase